MAHVNSPYDFNAIPIHILGSIYERFLGKIIITTDHRARVEEKPAVRKAGGVYYTPEYIVRYIVENTVGKLIEGKSPAQIAGMRFADIACGSGSFLLGVYDVLLRYFRDWHNARPKDAAKAGCVQRNDGAWHLSLHQRREILINNIYGVDIDRQAVEVAQLSLYLKLLEEETTATARAHQLEFHETLLPPLNKNIVCGNSLIGTDILSGQLLEPVEEKKLNPMDFEQRFPEVMKRGGFDAIVGNPPWGVNLKVAERNYLIQKSVEVADFESSQYFLVRCNSLLNPRGLLGAIVPNTFVLNVFAKKCRDRLLAFFALQSILDLSDGDVFLGPSVRSLVTIFSRNKREDCQILRLSSETNAAHQIHTVSQKELSDAETWKGFLAERTPQAELVIRLVQNKPSLADFFEARQGYIPYRTTTLTRRYGAIKAREIVKNRLWHGNKRVDSTCQKELQGVDVGRFSLNWSGVWVQYGEWVSTHLPLTVFSGPRVLIREITGRHPHALSATFTDEVFVHNPSVLAVLPRYTSISPKFAVGILNSRLLSLVFSQVAPKAEKGLFPKIIITDAKRLPFPAMNLEDKATKVRHDRMVSLVDQMLSAKRHLAAAKSDGDKDFYGAKCAALDRQIDALVYELYGLTPEEIQIVEGALLHEL
ncbi:MAG: N-6 DNA methylase [Candidatus Sumerlaeota bacterium]|nr:N-6 DNA methylase [Candidatus Sumerlaeota bacterium]